MREMSTHILAIQVRKSAQVGKMLIFCAFVTPWLYAFDPEAVWGCDLVSWLPLL